MEEFIGDSDIGGVGLQNDPPVFSRLEEVTLYGLPKLRSIYNHVLPFPCLEEMSVTRCPELKKLPLNSQSAKNTLRMFAVDREWWDTLE